MNDPIVCTFCSLSLRVIAWSILLAGCTSPALLPKPSYEVSESTYVKGKEGFVVVSAIWARALQCAGFKTAQLRSFGFDRMPVQAKADDVVPEVLIEGSAHYTEQQPRHYVLALEPGSYALTRYEIDVAESTFRTKVGTASRSTLIDHGQPVGGTFDIQAGELVYIGHFGLDCDKEPSIWRYYPEGPGAFENYKAEIKWRYPYLDVETMQVRLFKSALFGRDLQPR